MSWERCQWCIVDSTMHDRANDSSATWVGCRRSVMQWVSDEPRCGVVGDGRPSWQGRFQASCRPAGKRCTLFSSVLTFDRKGWAGLRVRVWLAS